MTKTITGTLGCQFDLTVIDTLTATGSKTINFKTEDDIRTLTYSNASKIAVLVGSVGSGATTSIDLTTIQDVDNGTYYLRLQDNSAIITLSTVSCIIIHNKSLDSITITGGANSIVTSGDTMTVEADDALQLVYPTAKTVDATHKLLILQGASNDLDCEIYILGN